MGGVIGAEITASGVVAVSLMMTAYAAGRRHRRFVLVFAVGCLLSSAYRLAPNRLNTEMARRGLRGYDLARLANSRSSTALTTGTWLRATASWCNVVVVIGRPSRAWLRLRG